MRYIGGKKLLLPYIKEIIESKTNNVKVISDLFSGSGIVSKFFKEEGYNTISNDLMYFCTILLKGTLALNKIPNFKKLIKVINEEPIQYLNNLKVENTNFLNTDYFIYNNYSPIGNRMYFTEKNALKIDLIRLIIDKWKKEKLIDDLEFYYLLTSLLEAVPYVSNITGVYGAYLKFWDKRALKDIILEKPKILECNTTHKIYNEDANELTRKIKKVDLSYLDPPYNQRQYLPNYHILETIAKYDNPNIKGVTGLREYVEEKSKYCVKKEILNTFDDLIKNIKTRYILLSYNTEGLLKQEEIINILKKYGIKNTIEVYKIKYNRYKNNLTNDNKNLKELLFFIEKKEE